MGAKAAEFSCNRAIAREKFGPTRFYATQDHHIAAQMTDDRKTVLQNRD